LSDCYDIIDYKYSYLYFILLNMGASCSNCQACNENKAQERNLEIAAETVL